MALPMHPSSSDRGAPAPLDAHFAPADVQPSYQPSAPFLAHHEQGFLARNAHLGAHIKTDAMDFTPKSPSNRLPSIPPRPASPPLRHYSRPMRPEEIPSSTPVSLSQVLKLGDKALPLREEQEVYKTAIREKKHTAEDGRGKQHIAMLRDELKHGGI